MAELNGNIEANLSVGAIVLMQMTQSVPAGRRLRTAIRGWRRGQYILLDRPEIGKGILYDFDSGQPAIVRYLRDGMACAFDTEILDWDARFQGPSVRIRWPDKMECLPFRKSERLKLRLPCSIHRENGTDIEGDIEDVSFYGCRTRTKQKLKPADLIVLNFNMPDGSAMDNVSAIVRNITPGHGGFVAGCEFVEGQDSLESDLAFFITSTFERQRIDGSIPSSITRVLIVDSAAESTKKLKVQLEHYGCDVVQAHNAVDALYRLRMSSPAVAIINQNVSDMSGIDLGRIIHQHKDFATLSLYLYGINEEGIAARAVENGFRGHFSDINEIAGRIFGDG